jgi:hypothetical protein
MRFRISAAALAVTISAITPAYAEISATGQFDAKISIATKTFKGAQTITVTGSNFDETVGIYLAYCVLPKKGASPTPCGGGVNKSGIGDASYWISSNPPPYGAGLAIAFKPGGRFSEKLEISKKIGAFDCTKVKCAVTVRSDHLHEGDRTHDLFIPISFSKK